jgi:3-oxoacyl-[acyl-carrier-protein] synthase-3
MACRKVIESSGVDPNRIGIICNTSVWRDYLEPGMAVCIHHELGLPGVIRVFTESLTGF